jgi:hypothetical protein
MIILQTNLLNARHWLKGMETKEWLSRAQAKLVSFLFSPSKKTVTSHNKLPKKSIVDC